MQFQGLIQAHARGSVGGGGRGRDLNSRMVTLKISLFHVHMQGIIAKYHNSVRASVIFDVKRPQTQVLQGSVLPSTQEVSMQLGI